MFLSKSISISLLTCMSFYHRLSSIGEREKFKESACCLLLNVKNLALIFCFDSTKSATDISIKITT